MESLECNPCLPFTFCGAGEASILIFCGKRRYLEVFFQGQCIPMMHLHCHYYLPADKRIEKKKRKKTFDKCCMKHNNRVVVLFLQFLPQCMFITKSVRCILGKYIRKRYTHQIVVYHFSYLLIVHNG